MSSAARTNLTSQQVTIDKTNTLGQGQFRIAYDGTYIGGNRNNQEAVCKTFKRQYRALETEFYATDFQVVARAIQYAEDWNRMCEYGKEILVTKGDVMNIGGTNYLVEPLIRYYTKYTSNNGWIAGEHQGRYRYNRFSKEKCRFELTDPAICSRNRSYGPTDLGEKGIESFFANHDCNRFCNVGSRWQRPCVARHWFEPSRYTSMLRSTATNLLYTRNRARFTSALKPIYDSDSDDSW